MVGATGGGVALPPRILNMTVPQVGHLPFIALRPFFMTSSTPSAISFLALHLTQYPSAINLIGPIATHHAPGGLMAVWAGPEATSICKAGGAGAGFF